MDEPTNYLDLETMHVLEDALRAWRGTLILASHDRWLIQHWHGRKLQLTPPTQLRYSYRQKLKRYSTCYSNYCFWVASSVLGH